MELVSSAVQEEEPERETRAGRGGAGLGGRRCLTFWSMQ
jgi:hypothetical protein